MVTYFYMNGNSPLRSCYGSPWRGCTCGTVWLNPSCPRGEDGDDDGDRDPGTTPGCYPRQPRGVRLPRQLYRRPAGRPVPAACVTRSIYCDSTVTSLPASYTHIVQVLLLWFWYDGHGDPLYTDRDCTLYVPCRTDQVWQVTVTDCHSHRAAGHGVSSSAVRRGREGRRCKPRL